MNALELTGVNTNASTIKEATAARAVTDINSTWMAELALVRNV